MKVAVIGRGNVGQALAPAMARAGHEVVFGVRDPASARPGGGDVPVLGVAQAAADAEVIVLAVQWAAVGDTLAELGPITGKVLVDCTNPLDFQGGLAWLIEPDQSAAQLIQGMTDAHVVKAFNQVGAAVMAAAADRSPPPLQFAAGDDDGAKAKVIELMRSIGFDARDAGGLAFARDLESMARLWIAQAFGQDMPAATAWALVPAGG